MFKKITIALLTLAIGAAGAFAQNAQLRSAVAGQKYKIKGVVVSKENDTTMILRDAVGVDTKIVISPNASIKNNSFWGGDKYPVTAMVRGMTMETEGVGDSTGSVVVNKIRFDKSNLLTAQALETRVAPVEERMTAA